MAKSQPSQPVSMHVVYRPKKGKENEVEALVRGHWPALHSAGLVTREPARVWKASDKQSGSVFFVEMFSWRDGAASTTAHHTPAVKAVWGPMEPLLDGLELSQVQTVGASRPAKKGKPAPKKGGKPGKGSEEE
jgi:quinol monooxygenase YgiN